MLYYIYIYYKGLPVEMSIVKVALNNNLLVVIVSSVNRFHKCWSNNDVSRLI